MPHSIRIRSASKSENNYEVGVEGGIEPKSGIGGRDHIENDGRRAVGRVVGGTDEYSYWGAKTAIRADNPGDLEISINGGAFKPSTKYGADPLNDTDDTGSPTPPEPTPVPESPPAEGYRPENTDTRIWEIPDARNQDQRPVHTTRPVDLWVAPDGDDSAPGTRRDPIHSLHEVARRVPTFLFHRFIVHLEPGVHENPGGGGMTLGPHVQAFFTDSRRGFEIIGEGDSPEDTTIRGYPQLNINFWANGSRDNAKLANCVIESVIQCYRGAGFGVENCTVTPPAGDRGYDSYGGSMWLNNVQFVGTDWIVNLPEGGEVLLDGCSGRPREGVVAGKRGTVRDGYGNDFNRGGEGWASQVNDALPVSVVHGVDER